MLFFLHRTSFFRLVLLTSLVLLAGGCGANSSNTANRPAGSSTTLKTTSSGRPEEIDADAQKEFTETASGLRYRILRKSDGEKPTGFSDVLAHYRGWTEENGEFDSSYKRGEPSGFRLDSVIPGWTEGLQLIGVGGMIELEIPPELGYGDRPDPRSGIPPGATLHFIVELEAIQ